MSVCLSVIHDSFFQKLQWILNGKSNWKCYHGKLHICHMGTESFTGIATVTKGGQGLVTHFIPDLTLSLHFKWEIKQVCLSICLSVHSFVTLRAGCCCVTTKCCYIYDRLSNWTSRFASLLYKLKTTKSLTQAQLNSWINIRTHCPCTSELST